KIFGPPHNFVKLIAETLAAPFVVPGRAARSRNACRAGLFSSTQEGALHATHSHRFDRAGSDRHRRARRVGGECANGEILRAAAVRQLLQLRRRPGEPESRPEWLGPGQPARPAAPGHALTSKP